MLFLLLSFGLFLVKAALHWLLPFILLLLLLLFLLLLIFILIFILLLVLLLLLFHYILQSKEGFLSTMNLRVLGGREDLQGKEVIVSAFKAEGRRWHVIRVQLVEGEVTLINQSQHEVIRAYILLIKLSSLLCNLLLD